MPLKFRSQAWSQMCFIMSFSQINRNITDASRSREIWHKVVIAFTAVFAHFVHASTVDAHSRGRTFVNIWKQNATNKMRHATCLTYRFNNHNPHFGHKNISWKFSKCKVFSEPWGLFYKVPKRFGGLFRVPQFPLCLRNAGVLSHQTSQSSWFFLH